MEKQKHNYAFIDGQNLHSGVASLGWKLDHKKFRKYLADEFDVVKAYLFIGFMEEHQDLYNALQEAGFILVFKPLVRHADGVIKGNVDADMVLHAMIEFNNFDKAVIISGDGDFTGLLRHLSNNNKLRQVIIPNRGTFSSLFKRLEDFDKKTITFMNDLRGKLAYRSGRRQQRKPNKDNGKDDSRSS